MFEHWSQHVQCNSMELYSVWRLLSTLSADAIRETRGERGLLTGRIQSWYTASSGCASHAVCVCDVYSIIPPLCFTFSPLLLALSPYLSSSNKAEYLFPSLRLSGLLKGVGDWADIRLYMVCVWVCVLYVQTESVYANAAVPSLSRHAVWLSLHPSLTYSCVFLRANTLRLKVADSEPWGLVQEKAPGRGWLSCAELRSRKVTVACYYLPALIEFISIAESLWQNSV